MRLIFVFISVMLFSSSMAQQHTGFAYHDSLTYNLYLEGRWKDLSEAGRAALDEGHDYYYMRMRIGISLYERSYYAAAAKHFRRALDLNSGDPVATEYLFYCHLYTGEFGSASRMLESMAGDQSSRVREESRLANNTIWLSMYYNDFHTDDIFDSPSDWFADTQPGTVTVTRLIVNPSVSMSHQVSPGVYYNHSFNNVTKHSLLDYYDGTRLIYLDNHKVLQNQYRGSFTIAGAGGLSFTPWAHFALVTYDYILAGGSYSSGFYSVQRASKVHYSLGMNVRQRTGYISVDGSLAVNRYGTNAAIQADAGIVVYPFGNNWFYAGIRSSGVFHNKTTLSEINPVYVLTTGFSVPGIFSIDVSSINGDLRNYSAGNGLYLFNSPDYITQRLLLNLSVPLSKKSGLTLYAGGGRNSHATSLYTLDNQITEFNKIVYHSFNINGGLLWNF
ncbi:MAG: hypothetical protein IH591_12390 [Bacteroidales bacterium]|nr:hypothetical protein [Bacteroidales bacterium]